MAAADFASNSNAMNARRRIKKLSDMVIRRNPNANPDSTSPTNIQSVKQSSRSRTRSASVFAISGTLLPGAQSAFSGAADDSAKRVSTSNASSDQDNMERMQLYSDIQSKEKEIDRLEDETSLHREEIDRLQEGESASSPHHTTLLITSSF